MPDPRAQGFDTPLGGLVRARRIARGLTLEAVADAIGCTKGYLSGFETGQRPAPADELLEKLDACLWPEGGENSASTGRPPGGLVQAARWERMPRSIRRDVETLLSSQRTGSAARARLSEILAHTTDEQGKIGGSLDEAYRSGELKRLIDRIAPARAASPVPVPLPLEVPLINKVAAGYPTSFTDLGYPPRHWEMLMANLARMAGEEGVTLAERTFTTNSRRALKLAQAVRGHRGS